jgi:pyrroline-5-carboxylate reductase
VTAVSGSGPAYAFLLAEAMIDAGVGLGLTRVQASELAVQTIRGAGILLSESGLSPVDLRAAVTSPGGTTAEAIREFEASGFRHGVYQAMRACAAASANAGRRVDVEGLGAAAAGPGESATPRV